MAKRNKSRHHRPAKPSSPPPPSHKLPTLHPPPPSTLWYRILLLLHDLSTFKDSPSCQHRPAATKHELYISAPYFTAAEAVQILATPVLRPVVSDDHESDLEVGQEGDQGPHLDQDEQTDEGEGLRTVESVIKKRFKGFLEKRRASGDARPCGPHDILPVYMDVFGVGKGELEDEGFVRRVGKEKDGLVGMGDDEGVGIDRGKKDGRGDGEGRGGGKRKGGKRG